MRDQWTILFTALGVPGIVATLVTAVFRTVRALKSGLQALLRAQMIAEYNKWNERGFAPIYARENFENCWRQYHNLGANGVMDDVHQRFMALPTSDE